VYAVGLVFTIKRLKLNIRPNPTQPSNIWKKLDPTRPKPTQPNPWTNLVIIYESQHLICNRLRESIPYAIESKLKINQWEKPK